VCDKLLLVAVILFVCLCGILSYMMPYSVSVSFVRRSTLF